MSYDYIDPFDPMNQHFLDEVVYKEEYDEGDFCRKVCPNCGTAVRVPFDVEIVQCRNCGCEF